MEQGIQGTPLAELPLERFILPITTYLTSFFLTSRAAARHMLSQRSGVILTLTATPARFAAQLTGGMAPSWAGIEALTRSLPAGLAPHGVRAVCLRPDGLPETATIDVVFGQHAATHGISREQFTEMMASLRHVGTDRRYACIRRAVPARWRARESSRLTPRPSPGEQAWASVSAGCSRK